MMNNNDDITRAILEFINGHARVEPFSVTEILEAVVKAVNGKIPVTRAMITYRLMILVGDKMIHLKTTGGIDIYWKKRTRKKKDENG